MLAQEELLNEITKLHLMFCMPRLILVEDDKLKEVEYVWVNEMAKKVYDHLLDLYTEMGRHRLARGTGYNPKMHLMSNGCARAAHVPFERG